MGHNKSKIVFLTYEEAQKRVSESELKRLKEAFKRYAGSNSTLTPERFATEVLGGFAPKDHAEELYNAFKSSSGGLTFKDLVVGLVLLTKGTSEERCKFLFNVYCHESGQYIDKMDMDDSLLRHERQLGPEINKLFSNGDRVNYEQFREWIMRHTDVTVYSTLLLHTPNHLKLTDDTQLATFYQTLAGVTHLDENSIMQLEKSYWKLRSQKSNKIDLESFQPLVSPPVPWEVTKGLFMAFDENGDDHIDLKEMACGISASCQGPLTERQKFCFKIFDTDRDGKLSRSDLIFMLSIFGKVKEESGLKDDSVSTSTKYEEMADNILAIHDMDKDGMINKEEYLMWTVGNPLSEKFLSLLYQICHIIFGLKPQFRAQEKEVVLSWLAREEKRGLQSGKRVYLVSTAWWKQWLNYVNYTPQMKTSASSNDLMKSSDLMNNNSENYSTNDPQSANSANSPSSIEAPLQLSPTGLISNRSSAGNNSRVSPSKHKKSASLTWSSPNNLTNLSLGVKPDLSGTNTRLISVKKTTENGFMPGATTPGSARAAMSLSSVSNYSNNANSPRGSRKHAPVASAPGIIDNSILLQLSNQKSSLTSLTDEGGLLRSGSVELTRGRDFELLPERLWWCLYNWYGATHSLPRPVIPGQPPSMSPKLELHLLTVRIMRHQKPPAGAPTHSSFPSSHSTVAAGGFGGAFFAGMNTMISSHMSTGNGPSSLLPRRQVTHRACFSRHHTVGQVCDFLANQFKINRDEMRLWLVRDDANLLLLEDEGVLLKDLGFVENQGLLVEQRNFDLTWPEELIQLAKNKALVSRKASLVQGVTGLSNLGNTCFFNSAIQCLSNTSPLTEYFRKDCHFYELNKENPIGSKGHMAHRYGELIKTLWSGATSLTAPLKIKMTVEKRANQFTGYMQHDAQELLAVVLDGLHEDLNRITGKVTYKELKDSDGRPDELVAKEAWEAHTLRNQSIIVDLFHGQLKSQVRCQECGHLSVRFDPMSVLSLPLPMESSLEIEVIMFQVDGSTPVKYCLLMNPDDSYTTLKKSLSKLSGIPANQILFGHVDQGHIRKFPDDSEKLTRQFSLLCAYVIGEECAQKVNHNSTSKQFISSNPVPNLNSVPSFLPPPKTYLILYHRKMMPNQCYFLSHTKFTPEVFGLPLVISLDSVSDGRSSVTNSQIYQAVWKQVARMVSVSNKQSTKNFGLFSNHAKDGDIIQSDFPFELKTISSHGTMCVQCNWQSFCRGCIIPCDNSQFMGQGRCYVAIDWDATSLHLCYQSALEKDFVLHSSVSESRQRMSDPMDLDKCLQAFTREEELGADELYNCSKCKGPRRASKKLDLWTLPPILIIHLKRFQFVNNRWQKSHKIVHCPKSGLDLSKYIQNHSTHFNSSFPECDQPVQINQNSRKPSNDSLSKTQPNSAINQSTVESDQRNFSPPPVYNLYAVACHEGQLQMGHYITYAKNPNGKWYLFNDSSCKEVLDHDVYLNSAYILFYEREGIRCSEFLPNLEGKQADYTLPSDEVDSELKKMCSLM